MVSGLPFDDFRNLAAELPSGDDALASQVRAALAAYAGEGGAGRAGEIVEWLARWSGRPPRVLRPVVALFAGTHGIAPDEIGSVRAFIERRAAGGGPVNQACIAGDLGLKIFDLALDVPTGDITRGEALDEKAAAATMAFGMEAVAGGADLLVLAGHGGEGGRMSAETLQAALLGLATISAPGSDAALGVHHAHLADPLEALRRVGGRETAALAGAILAARMEKVPVILDGPGPIAAASVLDRLAPGAAGHCMAADRPASPTGAALLASLGMVPLLDLGMAVDDGAAGAIAAGIVKAAALLHAGAVEVARTGPAPEGDRHAS